MLEGTTLKDGWAAPGAMTEEPVAAGSAVERAAREHSRLVYRGALLLVTHDVEFARDVEVTRELRLPPRA